MQIGGPGPGAGTADYRAFIYVNGWLIGRYVNNVGPQHQFYVPAGILNDHGANTLAIAVWGLDGAGGGLDQVSLVADGQPGGRRAGRAGGQPRVLARGVRAAHRAAADAGRDLVDRRWPTARSRSQATLRNPTGRPLSARLGGAERAIRLDGVAGRAGRPRHRRARRLGVATFR